MISKACELHKDINRSAMVPYAHHSSQIEYFTILKHKSGFIAILAVKWHNVANLGMLMKTIALANVSRYTLLSKYFEAPKP